MLTLAQSGNVMTASVDGVTLMTVGTTSLSTGYMGVYAGTEAFFDNFAVTTPCSSCTGGAPGDMCTFTCAPGYNAIGNTTSVCVASGTVLTGMTATWVGTPLTCTLPPPVFSNSFRSVPENSPAGTPVGAPLVVFMPDPTAAIAYTLVSVTPNNLPATATGGPWVFNLGSCSGQLSVGYPVLDFEMQRTYSLVVNVYVIGNPALNATAVITVNVLNVNEPPIIPAGQVRAGGP